MPKKATTKVKKNLHENCLFIKDLPVIMERVKELMDEKQYNPGVIQEDEAGLVFIDGEPNMVIDGKYVPHKIAEVILQTRKVVREFLILQNLINK